MPRIKEGFKGERAIVLPAFLIEELKNMAQRLTQMRTCAK